MKKLITILLLAFLPIVANADAIEVDGIWYKFISDSQTVEVTPNPKYYTGEVIIPDKVSYGGTDYSVITIGEGAFEGCSGLISVIIPNSVTIIGERAFAFCGDLTSVIIPNSVTQIGGYAFNYCTGLTSISLPNSVTSIEEGTFMGCGNLTSVTIPNSVTSIGEKAFSWCWYLSSVNIPNSVTSIGKEAFYYCPNLTSATIGNGITWIDQQSFDYCESLTDIYCKAEKVPQTPRYLYSSITSTPEIITLHVPVGCVKAYKDVSPWNLFKEIVEIEEDTCIKQLSLDNQLSPIDYFTIEGMRIAQPQQGLNIIRSKDGTVKKVLIK